MRYLLAILVPVLAFAGEKFTTEVTVTLAEENAAITSAITDTLRTKTGTKLDLCWRKSAKAKARIVFDAGKPTTVELVENSDAKAATCLTKALRAVKLADAPAKVVATVELSGLSETDRNQKILEALEKLDGSKLATPAGFGSAVGGAGTGVGTTRDSNGRDSGSSSIPGDFTPPRMGPPPAKVALGPNDGTENGGLSTEIIDRVMRSRAGVFRACYQKELNRMPNLGGKVVIRFEIATDGTVAKAKVASTTLRSSEVEACLVRQVLRLKFPTLDGKAVINYPFVFANTP